jgi:predicted acyltransferase
MANWLDGIVIPANLLNKKGYDSEGFYSTFPAIVSGVSGLLAGKMLLTNNNTERRVILFFVIGTILVLCGTTWGYTFPIVKKIWTSSFVLLTSGWAFLSMALLIWIIDVNKFTTGSRPFIIFGSNAIAIYVLADVFETIFIRTNLRDTVFLGMVNWGICDKTASLIWAFFSVFVCYLAAHLLYSRKIFIKL